jgi:hypothetical protein
MYAGRRGHHHGLGKCVCLTQQKLVALYPGVQGQSGNVNMAPKKRDSTVDYGPIRMLKTGVCKSYLNT